MHPISFIAGLAGGGEREQRVAADAHRLGAERQRFQHVGAALHAAVHQHVEQVAGGVHDLGELVERRARAVELAAARLASSADITPFRQNCPSHSCTITATSSQSSAGSSISVK